MRFPPASPPMRPNMKIKHVAIARTFVGYKPTEIALTIAAHKLQLLNAMNAAAIAGNCVKKFNAIADIPDNINQTAVKKIKFHGELLEK